MATVEVLGTVRDDGTLLLDASLPLPPGRVSVTIETLPEELNLPTEGLLWQTLRSIWAGQKARGHIPRTVEDVEAERQQNREDSEERHRSLERLHEESRRLREQAE